MSPLGDLWESAFHSLRETIRLSSAALLDTQLFVYQYTLFDQPPSLGCLGFRRVVTRLSNRTEAGSASRPHRGESPVTHRRQPLKSRKSLFFRALTWATYHSGSRDSSVKARLPKQ